MSVHYQTNGTWSLALACKNKKNRIAHRPACSDKHFLTISLAEKCATASTTKFIYSENVELPSSERGIRDGLSFSLNYDSDSRKIERDVRSPP